MQEAVTLALILMMLRGSGQVTNLELLTPRQVLGMRGDLDDFAQTELNRMLADNFQAIDDFWRDLDNGRYVDPETGELLVNKIRNRANLWSANQAEAFDIGVLTAVSIQKLQWRLGATERHCQDCLRLDGQVHSRVEWIASGWRPKSSRLQCKGFYCDCRFVDVAQDTPSEGEF